MGDLIERVARAIDEASQPPGQKDYTILMENAARAAIAEVAKEFALIAENERTLDHNGEPDDSPHNYAVDRIAHNIRNALEGINTDRELERLAKTPM
jgi:hypothetical protein